MPNNEHIYEFKTPSVNMVHHGKESAFLGLKN